MRNGSSVTSDGTVTVEATDEDGTDQSYIQADAGGVAISAVLASKGSTTVNVTFGISVAVNDIENTVEALVDDSSVTADGAIDLDANSSIEIDALSIAGTLSANISAQQGSLPIAVAGAGAGSGNVIDNTVSATIENGSTVTVRPRVDATVPPAGVTLSATDDATITADAGAVSVALSYAQGTGVNVSVGISASLNEITNTVEAGVDDSVVVSDGSFAATAETTATIDALTFAGSGAGTITGGQSGVGVALAGAGTGSGNSIDNSTLAYIDNGSDVTTRNDGRVDLTATNASTITADAVAGQPVGQHRRQCRGIGGDRRGGRPSTTSATSPGRTSRTPKSRPTARSISMRRRRR